jgi:hypothetical protein
MLGVGTPTPLATPALFRLAARFATTGRRVSAFLEELLFACGENKLLPAVATCE